MNSNLYKDREYAYRLSKVVALFIRGPDCFDFSLYRSKNLDLAALSDNDALWEEFVMHGQFVGRVFRCVFMRLSAIQAAQGHLKDNAYLSDFI